MVNSVKIVTLIRLAIYAMSTLLDNGLRLDRVRVASDINGQD